MKKKRKIKKVKTDEWNERISNREERKTKEDDNDWNKKEDEEKDEYENEFHEELYDRSSRSNI